MDINEILAWLAVGLPPILLVLWMVYEWVIRPRKNSFKQDGFHIWLDKANGLVHLECHDDLANHAFKLGCGKLAFRRETIVETKRKWHPGSPARVTIYHTGGGISTGTSTGGSEGYWETVTKERPTGTTSIMVTEIDPVLHYHQKWATNHSLQQSKTERGVTTLYLRDRASKALKRWVHAHRHVLTPNEKLIRQQWDNSCKRLLKECRQDILVKQLKNPLELFDYTPAPNIRYLVLGKNGQGFFKSWGSHDMHAISLDQIRGDGQKLIITFPNGWQEHFNLTSDQIGRLHEIRRRWQGHQTKAGSHLKQLA